MVDDSTDEVVSSSDTLDMIKQYLKQLSYEKLQKCQAQNQPLTQQYQNLINGRIFDQLKFNGKNKLLSLVDADLRDF